MVNVQRWSALGVGMCAALVLVAGCKNDGGGIGGIGGGAPTNTAAGGAGQGGSGGGGGGIGGSGIGGSGSGNASGGGFNCQVAKVSTCLMPKPDNTTTPSGKWATDGAMSRTDYVNWFTDPGDERDRENSTLTAAGFVSAGYEHWQNAHGTQAEIALTSFGSTSGATQWIDYDNQFFGDNDQYQKQTSLVPGTYVFQATTANDDGTYSLVAIGRFGKVVMEFFAYAKSKTDAVAQNNLSSWSATQVGILKRAAGSS